MALNASTTLPYSVRQLTDVFTDEAFIRHTSDELGGELESATVDGDTDGAFTLTVTWKAPAAHLPEMARGIVGDLNITQTEKWTAPADDGSRDVNVQVVITGVPLEVSAVQRLLPDGDGTRVELEGEVTSSVPFLGPQIVAVAEPMMADALKNQVRLAGNWLDTHH